MKSSRVVSRQNMVKFTIRSFSMLGGERVPESGEEVGSPGRGQLLTSKRETRVAGLEVVG
jgi:hypothetical protein